MEKSLLKSASKRRKNVKDALAFAGDLESQLRMAGRVQRDFLPKQLPDCSQLQWGTVFLPAEWVSGDIYDIVRLDEQNIGFYVADVVGHGMPAALLTIFLKQALIMRQTQGNTYHIFEPAEVMTNLNSRLTEQKLSGNQFITCCYCLLNLETLQLTYARAGHPEPILISADRTRQILQCPGSLLGVFPEETFESRQVPLAGGDRLILYTDGAESVLQPTPDSPPVEDVFTRWADLPRDEMLLQLAERVDSATDVSDDITVVGMDVE